MLSPYSKTKLKNRLKNKLQWLSLHPYLFGLISSTLSPDLLTAFTLSRCALSLRLSLAIYSQWLLSRVVPKTAVVPAAAAASLGHCYCSISATVAAPSRLPRLLLLCQLRLYYCELLIFLFYLSKCSQNTVDVLRLCCLHAKPVQLCRINLGCSLRTPLTNPSLELHHTIVAEYQGKLLIFLIRFWIILVMVIWVLDYFISHLGWVYLIYMIALISVDIYDHHICWNFSIILSEEKAMQICYWILVAFLVDFEMLASLLAVHRLSKLHVFFAFIMSCCEIEGCKGCWNFPLCST